MIDVYLLLGSNLGDRNLFLHNAIAQVEQVIAPVIKASSVYETQSWGKAGAPDYLNQVVMLQTDMPAKSLLESILNIETALGRRREEKWGPRTIDIDILFYGQQIINEPGLSVPHPEMHKRRFTLEPMCEINAMFKHPGCMKTILQLKDELQDNLIVKKL
jgi:2-amino-4-hydroxy-6-hydroxymethyldihydropteridine diphosphokinase